MRTDAYMDGPRALPKDVPSLVPQACRAHFKTNELRIEVDTSSESGVSDWNYIDDIRPVLRQFLHACWKQLGAYFWSNRCCK